MIFSRRRNLAAATTSSTAFLKLTFRYESLLSNHALTCENIRRSAFAASHLCLRCTFRAQKSIPRTREFWIGEDIISYGIESGLISLYESDKCSAIFASAFIQLVGVNIPRRFCCNQASDSRCRYAIRFFSC